MIFGSLYLDKELREKYKLTNLQFFIFFILIQRKRSKRKIKAGNSYAKNITMAEI